MGGKIELGSGGIPFSVFPEEKYWSFDRPKANPRQKVKCSEFMSEISGQSKVCDSKGKDNTLGKINALLVFILALQVASQDLLVGEWPRR